MLNSGQLYAILPTFLHIETSNKVCSVSVSENGKITALRENNEGNLHASLLTPFIESVLAEANHTPYSIDAVCLSAGPGSYTGLRIGASAAKALCFAAGKPLIAISTLQAMVVGYLAQNPAVEANVLFCPMLDARRMEVYAALYNPQLQELLAPRPWIVPEEDFLSAHLAEYIVICLGNGAGKCKDFLTHKNIKIETGDYLSSLNLLPLAEKLYETQVFENIAYFEPLYLKTTPLNQN